jgi:drug/metabolite transporter, DME family
VAVTRPATTAPSTRSARLGLTAIALAAAGWALAAIVARRLFDSGVSPLDLSAARSVIAGLGLAPVLFRSHITDRLPVLHVICLGLSIALVNATYYLAIERLPVAVAIVLQYTAPVLVVGWTALIWRRPLSGEVLVALVAAVVGVVLVVELLGGDVGALSAAGIGFGLASAVLFGAYSLLAEPASRVYGALGAMARAFAIASIFWVLVQVLRGPPQELLIWRNAPEILFVGIAGTLLPFLLYVWGIGRVRAERATIAATLEPVFAAAAAWIWLGQTLKLTQLLGGVLVLGAVLLLQRRFFVRDYGFRKSRRKNEPQS